MNPSIASDANRFSIPTIAEMAETAPNLSSEQRRALVDAFASAYQLLNDVSDAHAVEVHMLIDHLEDICDPGD